MLMTRAKFKKAIVGLVIMVTLLLLLAEYSLAGLVAIKSTMKIQRMGGYIILINYETRQRWTDSIIFKARCKFDKGGMVFTSGLFDNVEQGWHKAEILISEAMKQRYGSLHEYEIELYSKGILIDTKNNY